MAERGGNKDEVKREGFHVRDRERPERGEWTGKEFARSEPSEWPGTRPVAGEGELMGSHPTKKNPRAAKSSTPTKEEALVRRMTTLKDAINNGNRKASVGIPVKRLNSGGSILLFHVAIRGGTYKG